MNWSKAKTILILFLLCTNIFLLSVSIISSYRSTRVSRDVIDAAVSLLESRGFGIDASLIPNIIERERIFSVENVISDYESFARLIFDEPLTVSSDGYSCNSGTVSYNGDSFDICYIGGLETPPELKSPAEKARRCLEAMGIITADADIDVTNDSNGIFTVVFSKTVDKKPLFDCKVSVELEGTRITRIYGNWFKKTGDSISQTSVLETVPGLLVKFSSDVPESAGSNITGLMYGYVISDIEDGIFHKQATIIPVLEITLDSGEKYYVDARAN